MCIRSNSNNKNKFGYNLKMLYSHTPKNFPQLLCLLKRNHVLSSDFVTEFLLRGALYSMTLLKTVFEFF